MMTKRFVLGGLLFLLTLAISVGSLSRRKQLNFMGGMSEEYFILGWDYVQTGSFYGSHHVPLLFRPPGYPVFVASVLKAWGHVPPRVAGHEYDSDEPGQKIVERVQAVLLAASAVLLFLILLRRLSAPLAFWISLAFACNPYSLVLVGLLHYSLFHIAFTLLAMVTLLLAFERPEPSAAAYGFAGIFWGATTLIRPLTLLLPAFLLVILRLKFGNAWGKLLKSWSWFCVGMLIVIAPYTLRNYRLTGRFIPVNAQTWVNVWAATVPHPKTDANHYLWWELWYPTGFSIFSRVTGATADNYGLFVMNLIPLEEAYKQEALKNLRMHPMTYAWNVVKNVGMFNLEINSVFLKVFQAIQHPGTSVDASWFRLGNPQNFESSAASRAFDILAGLLGVLSLGGIAMALRRRDPFLLVPGIVYTNFCLTHSLTYMDLMYYYLKLPFLFIFAGYFVSTLKPELQRWAVAFIAIFCFGLSLAVMRTV